MAYGDDKWTPKTELALKEVEAALGRPLGNYAAVLLEQGFIDDLLYTGARTAEDLAETVQGWARLNGERTIPQDRQATEIELEPDSYESERQEAVSLLTWAIARDDDEVCRFRDQHLGSRDSVIEGEELASWVKTQAAAGENYLVAQVRLDQLVLPAGPAGGPVLPKTVDGSFPLLGIPRPLPWFTISSPSLSEPMRVRAAGGPLSDLHDLAGRLANRYGWHPDAAATFVLTNDIPTVRTLTVRTQARVGGAVPGQRVTLTVDPQVDPRVVDRAYRQARRELLGNRIRPLKGSSLRIAAFSAARGWRDWPRLTTEWKRQHPDDSTKYRDWRAFRSVANNARRVLLRRASPLRYLAGLAQAS